MTEYHDPEDALIDLLSMRIEGQLQFLDTRDEMYEAGDENAPFFSEAYLYNLLGKDNARSILSCVSRICEACGYQMYILQHEVRQDAVHTTRKTPRTIPPD